MRFRVVLALAAAALLGAPAGARAADDLAVTLAAAPEPAVVGDTLTETATVTNAGTVTETGVQVEFSLLGEGNEALSSGSCLAIAVLEVCNLPDLPPGARVQAQVAVTGLTEGSLTVNAAVRYENDEADASPADDTTSAISTVRLPGRLQLALAAQPGVVTVGGAVTANAVVQNVGAGYADGATLKLSLPPDLQLGALPAGCAASGPSVTCDLGTIPSQGSATRAIPLTTTVVGSSTLLAAATWSRPDADPAVAQAAVSVAAPLEETGSTPAAPAAPRSRTVSLGSLVEGAPTPGACLRRRTLELLVRARRSSAVRRLDVLIGKRRLRRLSGAALARPFTVRTPSAGTFTLRLVATLADGAKLRAARPLRACARR